ncbi:DHH family phosphoesterase [Leptolyngbya sp. 15MV]|nr:DHH family phosphoesterase [Leptolyngbya sp. 15MV]
MSETQTPRPWASNTTLDQIAAWLRRSRRTVVLTHVKPDGDAIGSTLALARALNYAAGSLAASLGPIAVPWYFGPLPDWFPEVAGPTERRIITEDQRAEHDDREEPDAIVVLDTGAWTQLHDVREWLLDRTAKTAVIDHHQQGDPEVGARLVIDTRAAAACELATGLCVAILGLSGPRELPVDVATPLYLGLATDTGWFRHSNVSPSNARAAMPIFRRRRRSKHCLIVFGRCSHSRHRKESGFRRFVSPRMRLRK